MIKIRADLFEYVSTVNQQAFTRVSVLLPMSPFVKRDGSAVMGAGTLLAFAERFPEAPRLLGAKLPRPPAHSTPHEYASASGDITQPVNFDGVPVSAWLIQPRMGYRDYVYPHLAEAFEMSPASDEPDPPDVPGWACAPWESAIRASVPRILDLSANADSHIVIPYPNLGNGMTNDAFNALMGALPDNVALLTRGARRRNDGAR